MKDEKLTLKAILVTVDGSQAINGEGSVIFGQIEGEEDDDAAERLGLQVATDMKAVGAEDLLETIQLEKEEHLKEGTDVVGNDRPPVASTEDDGEKTVVESDYPPVLKVLAANGQGKQGVA
jgi:hypothetical protein